MSKPSTTTATVTRFDPLDRKWYMHTTDTKVSVPMGTTLHQLLKTLMKAAGQQESDSPRFRVVYTAGGLRLMLFGRGVHAEIDRLRHAEGLRLTEDLDADSPVDTRSFKALMHAFPPAWRKGWAKHRYIPTPESKRVSRMLQLSVRAMEDPDLSAALFTAEQQYKSRGTDAATV